MKGAFLPSGQPGAGPLAARRGPRARRRRGLEVKVPLVEPFTRPVLRDFAQDVMDAELARVDPDEMAQLLALLRESTVA